MVMDIKKFFSEMMSSMWNGCRISKVMLLLVAVLSVTTRESLQAASSGMILPPSDTVVSCPPDTVPFLETFDSYPASGLIARGVMPDCWTALFCGTDSSYCPHVTNDDIYSISGKSLVLFSSNHASIGSANYVVMPLITNDMNGTEISFQVCKQEWGINNYSFTLGYFVGELVAENFVELENIAVPPVNDGAASFRYSLNGRNIPQGARIAFQQKGGFNTGFYTQTILDSVAISFLPCAPVSGVAVSEIMMTTAHVSWTPGAWEAAWRVEYGESGFTPGTGIVVDTETPYADLTGLNGETTYDVYVQAVCDPHNLSDRSEAVSFYTYCAALGDTSVVVACDRYEWRDSVYTESGTYYDTVSRVADYSCDSIYTLELILHKSIYRFDTLEICQNQLPYQWYDTNFEVGSQTGTIFFHDTTLFGCDSIVELWLQINPSYYEDRYDTICENELPYTWNDTLFERGTTTGNYVFFRNSELGCDSIVTLHLLVYDSYDQMELLQVCSHDLPVSWRDTTFLEGTESGIFRFSRYSQHGCDSLVTLALYVTESDTVQKEDTICISQLPYIWGDTTFEEGTTTGYYLLGGDLSTGCESTLLHLVVAGIEQDMNHPDTVTICRNDLPYVWHGAIGDYTFGVNTTRGRHRVQVTAGGCTDTYYVFVDILENGDVEEYKEICSSELPFVWADTIFSAETQSGTYSVTRPAGNGCNRTKTLHLTLKPSYEIYDTLNICDNNLPYRWRNEWLQVGMTTGDYMYGRTSRLGCDSIVHLHLTVNRSYSEVVSVTVCENELPIAWRGHIIPRGTQSGTIVYDETSVTGCDSLVMLNLTVNPTYRHEESLIICSSDLPFEWRDTTFAVGTLSGIYLFEKQTVAGCDSTVILHLTINPIKEESITVDICRAELPFTWRDTSFLDGTNSGTFIFHRQTSANCDSTVTLTLNIHESFGANESLVVCENDLPVVWRGNIIPRGTRSGNIVFREQTSFGCDSIVILSVVVNPAYHQSEELTICENELPYTWRDTVFETGTRGGSFYFERSSINGCDSTVMLKLTVNPSFIHTDYLTICESDLPYSYGDTSFAEGTESGTFTLRRTTVSGCDSVITLHLTVNPTFALTDALELCESDLPYVYHDTVFGVGTQSGTVLLHRRTRTGCDSTVTLSLIVHPLGYQEKSYEICSTELPYVTEDTTFPVGTVSGLYNIYYNTQFGCDSVVAIRLTVRPVYNEGVSEVICENDLPFVWRDTTFLEGTRSGIFRFARSTQSGCDSVVTLALIVNPSYEQEESADVCADGFPFVWRDTTFLAGTQSGDFTFYRRTVNGCDSVVTLHLMVYPTYSQNEQLSICQNELPYQWRDTLFQTGTPSGFYTFHRFSSSGCDSTVTLALTVYPSSIQYYNVRICSNELPYTWSATDTVFDEGTVSGTYTFHYLNTLGCDSNIVLNLTVNPSYERNESLTLCQNDLPYYYEAGNHTFSTSTTSGSYSFNHPTAAGCDSTIILHLTIHPSYLQQEMVSVCENEFPYTWRDTTFLEGTVSGTYIFNRVSQFGCDSVVSLMLVVSPLPNVSITQIPNGSMITLVCSSNGNCSYLWSTGEDVTVITVPSDSAATYTVTATNLTTGCTNTASVNVATGIMENGTVSHEVIVYPNPTDGKAFVEAKGEVISEVRVFSLDGRMVKCIRVADTEAELNFDTLAKGTYLLHILLQQGDIVRKKLLVQ